MPNFVIEDDSGIKERFHYERPLNEDSLHALLQYARANYGADVIVREVTEVETESTQKTDC